MIHYSALKLLAQAAPKGPWFGPEYAPGSSHVFDADLGTLLAYESIDSEKDACLRYVAAANPSVVLGLIADNERLRSAVSELRRFATCEDMHHDRADRHEYGEHCKVLARIDALISPGEKP